jgi:hypothetical protein
VPPEWRPLSAGSPQLLIPHLHIVILKKVRYLSIKINRKRNPEKKTVITTLLYYQDPEKPETNFVR